MLHISNLQQIVCESRGGYTKPPENSINPELWFEPSLPKGWSILSFHFFVDWKYDPPKVSKQIWMTRLLNYQLCEYNLSPDKNAVLELFNNSPARKEFEKLEEMCLLHGHRIALVLLPEVDSCITDESTVWVIVKNDGYIIYEVNVSKLKEAIRKHSGGLVRMGGKGLTYATSKVECYLSRSDAAFPGDADALIVDSEKSVRFILEYKKHNLNSPIGDHLASKYYRGSDARKYKRLMALSKYYENRTSRKVPVVIFYYSTRAAMIRAQRILSVNNSEIVIGEDTGDMDVSEMSYSEVSEFMFNWLKIL